MRAAITRLATWWLLRRMKYAGHLLSDGVSVTYYCPECNDSLEYPDLGTLVSLRCSHQEFWS